MKILRKICVLILLISKYKFLMAEIQLTSSQLTEIGNKIWHNECNNSLEKLTAWKKNMNNGHRSGIGHFIWYPPLVKAPFSQTFPHLIEFLRQKNIEIPSWITAACPWYTQNHFARWPIGKNERTAHSIAKNNSRTDGVYCSPIYKQ